MTCTKPLDGYRVRGGGVSVVARGTRPPRMAIYPTPIPIPCGKCIGCRMEKARQWGIRCLHEAKMWPENSYVTLTYATENLPPGGTLCLRDVQLFMKRLRFHRMEAEKEACRLLEKEYDHERAKIRFFLGGEYGEQNGRPHYHALLFNVGFNDRVLFGRNARGEALYTSKTLSDLWSVDGRTLGFCTIGDVTFDSAVYCAKYALKKVTGKMAEDHYCVYDENGECFDRRPEFAIMSRRPGIGATYYERYGHEVRNLDSVVVDGKVVRPPRYYDRLSDREYVDHDERKLLCKCQGCINKRRRRVSAVKQKADNTDARLEVKERLMVIAAEKKERKL